MPVHPAIYQHTNDLGVELPSPGFVLDDVERPANAPAMVTVPVTISQEPRKIATAVSPGLGHTMSATPAPTDSRPVMTLVL